MSSNPVHGEVYSIQHYVIKFVSDLQQAEGFTPGTPVSSTNKTDRQDIAEILLKVALNTIDQPIIFIVLIFVCIIFCNSPPQGLWGCIYIMLFLGASDSSTTSIVLKQFFRKKKSICFLTILWLYLSCTRPTC